VIRLKTYPLKPAEMNLKLKFKADPAPLVQSAAVFTTPSFRSAGACEICGFCRLIERAHIIPARYGGPAEDFNLMTLCPNHHNLFDRDLLTWEEMQKIWPRVYESLRARLSDPNLQEWRSLLCDRYGVSFDPS